MPNIPIELPYNLIENGVPCLWIDTDTRLHCYVKRAYYQTLCGYIGLTQNEYGKLLKIKEFSQINPYVGISYNGKLEGEFSLTGLKDHVWLSFDYHKISNLSQDTGTYDVMRETTKLAHKIKGLLTENNKEETVLLTSLD